MLVKALGFMLSIVEHELAPLVPLLLLFRHWMIIPHFAESAKFAPASLRSGTMVTTIAPAGGPRSGMATPTWMGTPCEPKVYLAEMWQEPRGFENPWGL